MLKTSLLAAAASLTLAATGTTAFAADAGAKNVVLVHGGFVDGAG